MTCYADCICSGRPHPESIWQPFFRVRVRHRPVTYQNVNRLPCQGSGRNGMFEMTNENVARLLRGLTIAVGNRKNRILIYQFLAAEIRALHYSYGVGDGESYKRALTFLEECERLTLRSLVRNSAERHVEVTVDHAKRVFVRALKKLNASPALVADLLYSEPGKRPDFEEVVNEASK